MLLYLFDIYCQKTKTLTCKYRDDNKKVRKKWFFYYTKRTPNRFSIKAKKDVKQRRTYSPVDFPAYTGNDGQCAGERTERMEIGFPEAWRTFSTNVVKRIRGKKYFPFRENGRREGERMAATPTESTIRSICSEDKMVPVCSCYCVNIKRGRFFIFSGIKNKPKYFR